MTDLNRIHRLRPTTAPGCATAQQRVSGCRVLVQVAFSTRAFDETVESRGCHSSVLRAQNCARVADQHVPRVAC
jgi:hypothetical protein